MSDVVFKINGSTALFLPVDQQAAMLVLMTSFDLIQQVVTINDLRKISLNKYSCTP